MVEDVGPGSAGSSPASHAARPHVVAAALALRLDGAGDHRSHKDARHAGTGGDANGDANADTDGRANFAVGPPLRVRIGTSMGRDMDVQDVPELEMEAGGCRWAHSPWACNLIHWNSSAPQSVPSWVSIRSGSVGHSTSQITLVGTMRPSLRTMALPAGTGRRQ